MLYAQLILQCEMLFHAAYFHTCLVRFYFIRHTGRSQVCDGLPSESADRQNVMK